MDWMQRYRKTLIPVQAVIIAISLIAYFAGHFSIFAVLFYFVVMQIASVIGARWAARMEQKLDGSKKPRTKLPESLF